MTSLTQACRLNNNKIHTRLPIHKGLLKIILTTLNENFTKNNQPYLALMYTTLFLTAYYGLFRVSELTVTASNHAVKAKDIQIGYNKLIPKSRFGRDDDNRQELISKGGATYFVPAVDRDGNSISSFSKWE